MRLKSVTVHEYYEVFRGYVACSPNSNFVRYHATRRIAVVATIEEVRMVAKDWGLIHLTSRVKKKALETGKKIKGYFYNPQLVLREGHPSGDCCISRHLSMGVYSRLKLKTTKRAEALAHSRARKRISKK